MKFLADENVEKLIVDILRADGHDVLFISEITTSTIDEKLLDQANADAFRFREKFCQSQVYALLVTQIQTPFDGQLHGCK